MPAYTGDERRHNCNDHNNMIIDVAGVRSLMRWLIVLLPLLLTLVGYNIHATQQMAVGIAKQVSRVGGQLSTASVRIKNIERGIVANSQRLDDHEQRIRDLEQR